MGPRKRKEPRGLVGGCKPARAILLSQNKDFVSKRKEKRRIEKRKEKENLTAEETDSIASSCPTMVFFNSFIFEEKCSEKTGEKKKKNREKEIRERERKKKREKRKRKKEKRT